MFEHDIDEASGFEFQPHQPEGFGGEIEEIEVEDSNPRLESLIREDRGEFFVRERYPYLKVLRNHEIIKFSDKLREHGVIISAHGPNETLLYYRGVVFAVGEMDATKGEESIYITALVPDNRLFKVRLRNERGRAVEGEALAKATVRAMLRGLSAAQAQIVDNLPGYLMRIARQASVLEKFELTDSFLSLLAQEVGSSVEQVEQRISNGVGAYAERVKRASRSAWRWLALAAAAATLLHGLFVS